MSEWLEQGNGILLLEILAGIGGALRVILFGGYEKLYKECRRFERSRHKTVEYIRTDLKHRAEHGQEIKNSFTYTECRVVECKVLGMRIGWLENMLMYTPVLVLLCGIMTALAAILSGGEPPMVLLLLFVSGMLVLSLLAMDMILGLREKSRKIRMLLRDYIENNWSARVEWQEGEVLQAEEITSKCTDMKKNVVKDKCVKGKVRKEGKAQAEKRRLTEELLRERRLLEARSFAERRGREKEEQPEGQTEGQAEGQTEGQTEVQIEVQQRQEEAAVTQCAATVLQEKDVTYEMLLNEVLSEYLA